MTAHHLTYNEGAVEVPSEPQNPIYFPQEEPGIAWFVVDVAGEQAARDLLRLPRSGGDADGGPPGARCLLHCWSFFDVLRFGEKSMSKFGASKGR